MLSLAGLDISVSGCGPKRGTLTFEGQVYLAVAALLANGGQAKAAKLVARANVESISSEATKSIKQLKRGVASGLANPLDMLRGRTAKPVKPEAAPLFVAPRRAASAGPLAPPFPLQYDVQSSSHSQIL